jgi:hypothetical protein
MIKQILIFLICVHSFSGHSQSKGLKSININGDTPWVINEADYANMPVQKAIRDAERDWYKVFGYPPVIYHNKPSSTWNGPVIVFGSVENTGKLFKNKVPAEKEQFHISLGTIDGKNQAVIATGSDTRGTIYAIYTFCENVLGIDPMYIFTDNKPKKLTEIILTSKDEIVSKKPTFEYRGWFINDEELHDGMHRDPLGGNVISMEWMDKILETLLRCKGNMIIPESAPYPDATVYELCKRRGVAVSHHHVTPVGLNMMNWPKDVPFSYITHKDILVDAWTKTVKAQEGKEIVWIIGFRGQTDGPFWNTDPAAPETDAGRAKVIAEAMQTQTDIIRAQDPDATIVAALWNEQGAFYNAGLLKIPEGVCKMFADDGRGFMRDDGGKHVEKGDGLYYHVMMSMNTQNRSTEGVPPSRFYSELKRYVEKGATKYAIINVSNIYPTAMSVEAISDFLWDAEPALSKSPEAAMEEYMKGWYAKEFSPELASKLSDLRLHYYDIPYMRDSMPVQGRWIGARGENLIQYQIWEMLNMCGQTIANGEDLETLKGFNEKFGYAKEPVAETAEFFSDLWKETMKLAKKIPADRKDYYQSNFIYQVAIHLYSSRALIIINEAVDQYLKKKDPKAFAKSLDLALDEIEHIIDEAHKAEYGVWETMYMHIRQCDLWKTRLMLKANIARIEGEPYTSERRGYMGGSFWASALEYMQHSDGVFPYFYKHSGRGLDVLEDNSDILKDESER